MAFTNWDVARRWIQFNAGTLAPRVRNKDHLASNTMSYHGQAIFTYRTLLARWYDGYVLVIDGKWSNSTSRHRRILEQTLARNHVTYFRVPMLAPELVGAVYTGNDMHFNNACHLLANLELEAKRLVRQFKDSKGETPYWMADSLTQSHAQVLAYKEKTGVEIDVPDISTVVNSVMRARIEKWLAYNDPKAVEKRERAAARRLAKQALGLEDAA